MFLHFLHVPAFDDTLVDDSLVDEKGGLGETTEDWEVADDGLNPRKPGVSQNFESPGGGWIPPPLLSSIWRLHIAFHDMFYTLFI